MHNLPVNRDSMSNLKFKNNIQKFIFFKQRPYRKIHEQKEKHINFGIKQLRQRRDATVAMEQVFLWI